MTNTNDGEIILSMIKSTEYSDLISGLTTKEYIDVAFLLLFIVLVPIILTLCCIGIKRSEIWEKCKESKTQKKSITERVRFLRTSLKIKE